MKFFGLVAFATVSLPIVRGLPAPDDGTYESGSSVEGFDISHWQDSVDFVGAFNDGLRFVFIKATESTTYLDPKFSEHTAAAINAGFIHGAYHFAQPGDSSGSDQADYFLANGGDWIDDSLTLPGVLDLEVDGCSNMTTWDMLAWIEDFVDQYHSRTSRWPTIYTNRNWWETCVGNATDFHYRDALALASWNSAPEEIPGAWWNYTFWQYNDANKWGGDSDQFNGDMDALRAFARSW